MTETAEQIRARLAQATQPPPAEVKIVAPTDSGKAYFHQIPGSRFHYVTGPAQLGEIIFYGGMHITDDPAQIAALDEVVDRAGSMIYSARSRVQSLPAAERAGAEDAMRAAIIAHGKMLAAGEKVA